MSRLKRRAFALAFALITFPSSYVFAHALPGSVLIFSHEQEKLSVKLQVSLDDLTHVLPAVEPLENAAVPQQVSDDFSKTIDAYIGEHLSVWRGRGRLDLILQNVSLQSAANDHFEEFFVLVASYEVDFPDFGDTSALTLAYDAVMHEIRSHSATVYWAQTNQVPNGIVNFGYNFASGKPKSIVVTPPAKLRDQP